jgi:hypothetical protein
MGKRAKPEKIILYVPARGSQIWLAKLPGEFNNRTWLKSGQAIRIAIFGWRLV